MSRRSERLLGRLFKHDLGSPLTVALTALRTDEDIDTLGVTELGFERNIESMSEIQEGDMQDLENPSELGLFEEFIGVAEAANERMAQDYSLQSIQQEIDYLRDFDETRISGSDHMERDARRLVERISDLAENVGSYVERSEDFGAETVSIGKVFEAFESYGEIDYNGLEDEEVYGDEGLSIVANTILENSLDHGSIGDQEPQVWAEVEEYEEFYRINIWDDGSGLSDEFDPEEIFHKNRGENSGLGLYLGREITELFDGDLEYSRANAEKEDGFGLEWRLRKPKKYLEPGNSPAEVF